MSCAIINAPLSLISLSTKLGEGLDPGAQTAFDRLRLIAQRIILSLSKDELVEG